jgi:hypothetical protein
MVFTLEETVAQERAAVTTSREIQHLGMRRHWLLSNPILGKR